MFAYILGFALCLAMLFVWIYYFSPKRKAQIEQAKYDILDKRPKD